MKKAIFIRKLEDWNGEACVYKLGDRYVVISAVIAWGDPETYAFPCNAAGEVEDWCELPESIRGSLDHEAVLNNFGYTEE